MSDFMLLSKDIDRLGNLMKLFEGNTQALLVPGQPIVIRLDGKNFSRFTKGLKRPFDKDLRICMVRTMQYAAKLWNASAAYTQSDEITLILKNDINISDEQLSGVPFSSRVQKIVSLSAAKVSTFFNKMLDKYLPEKSPSLEQDDLTIDCPVFDSRAFNVPNLEWAALAMLWREVDCTKNAITQAAQCVYSHKELMNKGSKEKIEMMARKGVNFAEYPDAFKRGVFVLKKKRAVEFTAQELEKIAPQYRPTEPVVRTVWDTGSLARLASYETQIESVLFDELFKTVFTQEFVI